MNDKWKESYSSMERTEEYIVAEKEPMIEVELVDSDPEEEEDPEEDEEEEQLPELPSISGIERRDVKVLLLVKEILRRQKDQSERLRNAANIRQVDRSLYAIKPGSITAYMLQVLAATNDPMHITQLITGIEALGWHSKSVFHKYDVVRKALRDNSGMFEKVSRAKFRLCDGFRNIKPEKTEPPTRREKIAKLTTLKDVVVYIAKTYSSNGRIYPAHLHYLMGITGFSCAYSSVYRVMQCPPFVRDGMSYKVIDALQNDPAQG